MSNPIKRDKNLVLLSRDHHDGLLLSWKLRQGAGFGVSNATMAKYVQHEYELHLAPHFEDEERLLFYEAPAGDELTAEAVKHHAMLRELVKQMDTPDADTLKSFADQLEQHIRFEERVLFPHYEKLFDAEKLERIGRELDHTHAVKPADDWGDEFWIKK